MTGSADARPIRLTRKTLAEAARKLARIDPALGDVLRQHGLPPLLRRPARFSTLIHIILEQQVSVESAKATYLRLHGACQEKIEPSAIDRLGEQGLRGLGFSRQKTRYALALAEDCLSGRFNVRGLSRLPDEEVRSQISARLGLGAWSADVYLMTALLRPDVLPVGDLGLVKGMCELDDTDYDATDQIVERAETWRPLRSVATRMVWQRYVHGRGRDIF